MEDADVIVHRYVKAANRVQRPKNPTAAKSGIYWNCVLAKYNDNSERYEFFAQIPSTWMDCTTQAYYYEADASTDYLGIYLSGGGGTETTGTFLVAE